MATTITKHVVFVYGTLKRGGVLHQEYMQGAKFLAEDYLPDCQLYAVQWFPGVVSGPGKVYGEVFELENDESLKRLDILEDEGRWYRREKRQTGGGRNVFMYRYLGSLEGCKRIDSGSFDVAQNGKPPENWQQSDYQ